MTKIALTKREIQIMQILWNSKVALSARDITEESNGLSHNTVQAVLRKMLKLNYIKTDGVGYSGTVLTRKYTPVLTQKSYLSSSMTPVGMRDLIANFIESAHDEKDLDALENLINKKRKEIKK